MKDIVKLGAKVSTKDSEIRYYKNLYNTINKSLNLINREPAAEYDFG